MQKPPLIRKPLIALLSVGVLLAGAAIDLRPSRIGHRKVNDCRSHQRRWGHPSCVMRTSQCFGGDEVRSLVGVL